MQPTDLSKTTPFLAEIAARTARSLTADEADAMLHITPRAPERKPKNIAQGVCLSRMSRHALAPGVFVVLTEETEPTSRWSPFRLTPLGMAVRDCLEALNVKAA